MLLYSVLSLVALGAELTLIGVNLHLSLNLLLLTMFGPSMVIHGLSVQELLKTHVALELTVHQRLLSQLYVYNPLATVFRLHVLVQVLLLLI